MNDGSRKYTKLRFHEFTDNWKEKRIDELFTISAGGDISKNNFSTLKSDGFIYPVYANSLKSDGLFGFTSEYRVYPPALTVTGRGDIGYAKARYEPFYPIVRLLSLIPKEQLDIKFCEEIINRVDFKQESTGVPQLTVPQLGKYCLFLPSIHEQNKIGCFFSLIDMSIENLEEKIRLLELQRNGIMKKLFANNKNSKRKLGDLAVFIGGGTPSKAISDYWTGSIPWISSSDLSENNIHEVNVNRFISTNAVMKSATKLIQKGSILVVSRVGVGKVALAPFDLCTSQDFTNLTKIIPNPVYLAYILSYILKSKQNSAQGTSIKGITVDETKNLDVSVPSMEEQSKIAKYLVLLDRRIDNNKKKLKFVQDLKRSLIHKMFV
jgi:type I restriction enzyme S subunit